jgi:hypothetical protein
MNDAVAALLARAQEIGVKLWVESGEVKYRCRATSVPRTFLDELGSHRTALLQHLSDVGREPSEEGLTPAFERRQHDSGRVPSFRHASWSAVKNKLSGVDSTNLRFVVRVRGYLDFAALSFAFEEIRSRHEVLKATATEVEGRPWLVYGTQSNWHMEVRDVSHLPTVEREVSARAMASELVWEPMDLIGAPLFRAFVICVDTEEHVLGFVVHHFISDMVSMVMLGKELIRTYSFKAAGHCPVQAPETLQYGDYLLSSAEWIARPQVRARLRRWVDRLAEAAPMDLVHRPPQPPSPDFTCVRSQFEISSEITTAIESSAQHFRVSKFVLLLTVQKLLLASLTDQGKVTMGAVISGREVPVLAPVVGYFADRMHWTTDLDGDPDFAEAVGRVNSSYIEAMHYQFFRSDMVQEELTRRGKWLHAPVFNFVPYSRPRANSASDRFSNFPLDPAPFSTIPLPGISYWLTIAEMPQTMRGDMRFPHGSAEKLVQQFLGTLEMAMKTPTLRLSAVQRAFTNS